MSETFDIREFLAERAYPTTTVKALMSEKLAFELAAVRDEHASNTDKSKTAALDAKLADKEAEIEKAKFTIHLRATSTRAKEDIQSAALAEVPIQRDMYGRDDPEREFRRRAILSELIFAAHITKIVSPTGAEQAVAGQPDARDIARFMIGEAPAATMNLIDRAIARLSGDAEMEKAQNLDPNSSPES